MISEICRLFPAKLTLRSCDSVLTFPPCRGRAGRGRGGRAGPEGGAGGRAGSCCGAGRSSALPQVRAGDGGACPGGTGGGAKPRCPVCPGCAGQRPRQGHRRGLGSPRATPGALRGSAVAVAATAGTFPCGMAPALRGRRHTFLLRCKQRKISVFLYTIFLSVYMYLLYNTQKRWRKVIRPCSVQIKATADTSAGMLKGCDEGK